MKKTALITGASAGLGSAFAKALAQQGCDLVLVARREERLNQLADQLIDEYKVSVTVIAMDLGLPEAAANIFAKTESLGLRVDVLINNAGYGLTGRFVNHPPETYQRFLQVMVSSVVSLSRLYVEGMVARGYGRIINVSSVASFLPGTSGNNLYTGAKSLINSFSESLHKEVRRSGVHVTAICPGFTRTEFHDQEGFEKAKERIPAFMWSKAEEVVQTALQGNEAGKMIVVHGAFNRGLSALLCGLPPRLLTRLFG